MSKTKENLENGAKANKETGDGQRITKEELKNEGKTWK